MPLIRPVEQAERDHPSGVTSPIAHRAKHSDLRLDAEVTGHVGIKSAAAPNHRNIHAAPTEHFNATVLHADPGERHDPRAIAASHHQSAATEKFAHCCAVGKHAGYVAVQAEVLVQPDVKPARDRRMSAVVHLRASPDKSADAALLQAKLLAEA